jgi:hypothetical protein
MMARATTVRRPNVFCCLLTGTACQAAGVQVTLARLCRGDGSLLAHWATADHNNVIFGYGHMEVFDSQCPTLALHPWSRSVRVCDCLLSIRHVVVGSSPVVSCRFSVVSHRVCGASPTEYRQEFLAPQSNYAFEDGFYDTPKPLLLRENCDDLSGTRIWKDANFIQEFAPNRHDAAEFTSYGAKYLCRRPIVATRAISTVKLLTLLAREHGR